MDSNGRAYALPFLVVAVDNVDDNNMDIMDDVIKFMDTNVYNIITGYIKNGYSIP